jgi:ArsR family transcriptional regulator
MKSKTIDLQPLAEATRLLKVFSDPVRLRLLNLLKTDREICVCHLHEALTLPQPTVSRHLASLRKAKLVVARKEGLWVYYRLCGPRTKLHRFLLDGFQSCLVDLDLFHQDRKRLEQVSSCCELEQSGE